MCQGEAPANWWIAINSLDCHPLKFSHFLIYFFMNQFQFAFRKRVGNSLIHSFKTSHKVLREQYIKYKGNEMIEINLNEIFDCEIQLFEKKHISNVCVLHLQKYKSFDLLLIEFSSIISFKLNFISKLAFTFISHCLSMHIKNISLSLYFILWYFDEHSS